MHKSKTLQEHQLQAVAATLQNYVGQFCYPTGTGKTIIQAHAIIEDIKNRGTENPGVYVILAPRIMLAAQIYEEIWKEVVVGHKIPCNFFSLHSGKPANIAKIAKKMGEKSENIDQDDDEDYAQIGIELRKNGIDTNAENFGSGTSIKNLIEAKERAEYLGRPLIICSTYHSSEKLHIEDFNISMMLADEGHNAVATGFSHIHGLNAEKRFYFTATRKFTDGVLGMNNEDDSIFGPVLDQMSPREAVERGLILRPRIHFITTEAPVDESMIVDADVKAITGGFIQHTKVCGGIGAKLLVAARGTQHIRSVREHSNNFEQLRTTRPSLSVFEITSAHGALINGEKVSRENFLATLQGLKNSDEALIIHYDILSEGIDVPGITGIMPLRGLGISKFLQTFGRATRLHPQDRANLQSGKIKPNDLNWFVKQYAWIILPNYGEYGSEITSSAVETYIPAIRDFGFIPSEDVIISEARGEAEPESIEELNLQNKQTPLCANYIENIYHRLEDAEMMAALIEKDVTVCNLL